MPTTSLLAAFALLALATPLAGATESWGCHSYELYVGDHETGAGVSTDTAAAGVAAGGHYATMDGPPVVNPWLFSLGLGTEQNGREGFQRNDAFCDDTNGGEFEPDCFVSCTF